MHRPALIRQLDPEAERRISVLRAPGGFGKTTTLAEISRRAKKRGVLVAWLTVDEDDAPGLFGAHLAYAFEHAGLDLATPNDEDAWTATPLSHQIGMLVRAIETHAGPCLLILDELGRLPPQSLELLDRLLRRGPRNLRFALAFRSNPGLDLASIVLEGSAVVVTSEQFRFSNAEVTRFFGGKLPRRELTDIVDRTAGWPVALRIDRSMRAAGAAESPELRKAITRNFLDARLLRRLVGPGPSPGPRPGRLRLGRHGPGGRGARIDRYAHASRRAGRPGRALDACGWKGRRTASAPAPQGALRPRARQSGSGPQAAAPPADRRGPGAAWPHDSRLAPCRGDGRRALSRRNDGARRGVPHVAARGHDVPGGDRPVPDPGVAGGVSAARPHPLCGPAAAAGVRRGACVVPGYRAQAGRDRSRGRQLFGGTHRPPLHGGHVGRRARPVGQRRSEGGC